MKTTSLFACLLFFTQLTFAELTVVHPDWEKVLDKENVEVYTRDYEGSDIKAFKAVAILDAPLENVMAVMANPRSCIEWVHGCTVSYGFDEENFNKRYAYSVNDLPWPVKDRDYVLEMSTWSEGDNIFMELHAVDGKKEPDPDYVRVLVANTIYQFSRHGDNQTQMIWLQHTDPRGALPGWLVNALLVDIPFKSLKELENVAQLEKYQGAQIIYDETGNIVGVQK